ncbi:MAG: glycoside hydrolase family 65 protein [Ilumatobacteraceae bacterium]|nr:glycoside hydrolase family 65 protein [Ilumatobacteraceae bacterium]
MKPRRRPTGLPTHRFPVDPWALREVEHDPRDLGLTETLFAIGNGYIGMRANPTEGRDAHSHGTYLNGFHETWEIQHPEEAVAFAKTGQSIVNVPDAKLIKLYVDDEPLLLSTAEVTGFERTLDFRAGTSVRDLVWRTPAGKRVHVRSERLVSFEHRHLAMMTLDVTLLDDAAPVLISSQLLNRQDGQDEYHVRSAALGEGRDPRRARRFDHRVLVPRLQRRDPDLDEVILGYQCANSGMTLACGYRHVIETSCHVDVETAVGADLAKTVYTIEAQPGQTIHLVKYVSYHSSTGVPAEELADRSGRTLKRAARDGRGAILDQQRAWLDDWWARADIEIDGDPAEQQAIRWNLFQLAQASAKTQELGIAAKGVTAGGYDGHYFWDTEVYIVPFLAYTSPEIARKLLRFRWHLLPAARRRAAEMSQKGALYPWRTITGEEASAYYAAGTAQYHINAAVVFALMRYLYASGDVEFLADEGAEILVETARLWEDLGFYARNGERRFHIHGVTGPDEYTTVVNDNLYTNVMARFNLRTAAHTVRLLEQLDPVGYERLVRRTDLRDDEMRAWLGSARAMFLCYDPELGIHPQDTDFLNLEPWDFEGTPADEYPLLLHFHPLVIYRHQVLKQADVVLAMWLRGEDFDLEQKRRNFEYYDPITTGDSSLSACVQSIVAAQVGHHDLAWEYFREALFLDLCDLHHNTADGVHVASAGGVWAAVVHGFAGLVDDGESWSFDPRLPSAWGRCTFRLRRHGTVVEVSLDPAGAEVTVLDGTGLPLRVGNQVVPLAPGESRRLPRASS